MPSGFTGSTDTRCRARFDALDGRHAGELRVCAVHRHHSHDATFTVPLRRLGTIHSTIGVTADPDVVGGRWTLEANGCVVAAGAPNEPSFPRGGRLPSAVIGVAAAANGHGYYIATAQGNVYQYGSAAFDGSLPLADVKVGAPVAGIAAGSTGGYYLATTAGAVYQFGAPFAGSMPSKHLTITSAAVSVTSFPGGYCLVLRSARTLMFTVN